MVSLLSISLLVVCVVLLKKFIEYRRTLAGIGHIPGIRCVVTSNSAFGFLFKQPVQGLVIGGARNWVMKYSDFKYYGRDIINAILFFPRVETVAYTADAAVIKQITNDRALFPKPTDIYEMLNFFGPHIVAAEGDQWKRFRKLVGPAFSERNNRLVWDETTSVVEDLFETVWGDAEEVVLDNAYEVTLQIALFVIGAAGFGRRISWTEEGVVPPGRRMSFKEALHYVSDGLLIKASFPNWFLRFAPIKQIQQVNRAFEELEGYMLDMIKLRRSGEDHEERSDLFSMLLNAAEDDLDGEPQLTDRELTGNVYIFLLAGHETTGNILCFALALLALHPAEQERLYKQTKSVLAGGRLPTYADLNKLTYAMAVVSEALRMFPPVIGLPKYVTEDTTLTTTDHRTGEPVRMPLPKGSTIGIHIPGIHYNPHYWDEPEQFKPERFLKDYPRDAFLGFSAGPRSCLGRRFFETESAVVLTRLIMRYEVFVKEEPQFAGETFEQRKKRVLRARMDLTLRPDRVPLVLRRRA